MITVRIVTSALASLVLTASAMATEVPRQTPWQVAQAASSCSAWKSICETRGPGCAAKFSACLKSGCWTEGAAHGGATHCSLAKR